jgi:hypothetical protein
LKPSFRRIIFHPATVLIVALASAAIFAIVSYTSFEGDLRDLLVYYFAPIGVPFIAFLFDRAEHWPRVPWLMDIPLVILSFARAVFPIPFISGHALFLSYALLTTRTRVARWTALVVLIQVAYMKIFLWHDSTIVGGIVLGILAAWVTRIGRRSNLKSSTI